MENFIELNFLRAKADLYGFVNSMPEKYGISYILINEIIENIHRQTIVASKNDEKALKEAFIREKARENFVEKNEENADEQDKT